MYTYLPTYHLHLIFWACACMSVCVVYFITFYSFFEVKINFWGAQKQCIDNHTGRDASWRVISDVFLCLNVAMSINALFLKDDVDLYVGGMLESYDRPGPLFRKIIKEQFERIRDSDRFWFENIEHE